MAITPAAASRASTTSASGRYRKRRRRALANRGGPPTASSPSINRIRVRGRGGCRSGRQGASARRLRAVARGPYRTVGADGCQASHRRWPDHRDLLRSRLSRRGGLSSSAPTLPAARVAPSSALPLSRVKQKWRRSFISRCDRAESRQTNNAWARRLATPARVKEARAGAAADAWFSSNPGV
jgi:hypothetical protein